jgi:hypothetical protein
LTGGLAGTRFRALLSRHVLFEELSQDVASLSSWHCRDGCYLPSMRICIDI